jgi:hypothetical protein
VCASIAALAMLITPPGAPAARHHGHGGSIKREPRLRRPRAFASCASLVRYGRHYLAVTHGAPETPIEPLAGSVSSPPPRAGAPNQGAATPQASGNSTTAYSTTNNQEPGVQEPDTVKTDGSTIFAVSGNRLFAVGVAGGKPALDGTLDLGTYAYGSQLLLQGSHLIVISSAFSPMPLRGAAGPAMLYPSPYYFGGKTTITQVDVSDPATMKVTGTLSVDGSFVDARQNGSTARIVISSAPRAIEYAGLRGSAAGYVPRLSFRSHVSARRFTAPVAGCGQIARPAQFSGIGMLTILTVDLDSGLASTTTDALMADAQVVYGSSNSIYVATERWIAPATPAAELPATQLTQIDRFDASNPDRTSFVSSGVVPGYLLNQFSLSESNGYLRVASTSSPDWWNGGVPQIPSQSFVTVLATVGDQLIPVGQLSGLGNNQRIYSVRFVGDTGYVVTFRQVDPLYTIDLSDPTAPQVAGQLELEGYSSYLHPLGHGLLLGVGQDVGATNEPSGAQLELFDVADPHAPKLIQKTTLGQGSSSQVAYDHHAFLFWPPTRLAVLPVEIYPTYGGSTSPPSSTTSTQTSATATTATATATTGTAPAPSDGFTGAVGFHVNSSGISEVGRVTHPAGNGYTPPITRSIVIGDELYTLSDQGIMASSLDTLAPIAFAQFPPPPNSTPPPGVYSNSGAGGK